ncbi:MAG: TetR/AcrR family transcriptional regulator [Acetatifactor sp.]|nr:TetR/AcrR family transcriptional regulator [Acetatifactor sp.]
MREEAEKRQKLILRAKEEFMEKGFMGASLRSICSKAGVTTGAVYFFFQDKDALFHAVVDGVLQRFLTALGEHAREEFDEDFSTYRHHAGDHDEVATRMLNILYDDYDAAIILLTKASGSSCEHVLDDLIEVLEGYYKRLAGKYAASRPGKRIDPYMLHYMTHVQVDGFVHLLMHVADREEALRHVKSLMDFMVDGWLRYVLMDSAE